jgi:excisionase family DNA binding protein
MNDDLIPIKLALREIPCGKTKLYDLLNRGEIRAVKFGGRTLVSRQSIIQFQKRLPPYPSKRRAS